MICSLQWVGSIDLHPNEEAHANIIVDPAATWTDQERSISEKVDQSLGGEKLDAILCVAGGWAGGNAASKGRCVCGWVYANYWLSHMTRFSVSRLKAPICQLNAGVCGVY